MTKTLVAAVLCGWALAGAAAERVIDLTKTKPGETPAGWRSTVVGGGPPAQWRVVIDDAPTPFTAITEAARGAAKRPVIAQLSTDATDERFPWLILEDEEFGDFTLTLQFKTVEGQTEQMAGVAFRIQDERNYYVARASSLGRNFRFYRVADGLRGQLIGPNDLDIPKGTWHELAIQCLGNRIRLQLNGKDVMPELTDSSYRSGKIALWTKSDSVSYFANIRIDYRPQEMLATKIVRDLLAEFPRLLGLKIYATSSRRSDLHIVASSDPADLGQSGGEVERNVIEQAQMFAGKSGDAYLVTAPLRDRNGDPIAAVRLELKRFPGQTDKNAVARARMVLARMPFVRSIEELTE